MQFLVFQLYGPMAAWGDIAVGEHRPTYGHPSKSAIIGLVAAALGLRREQEQSHNELANALGFGVQVNSAGELLRDYHTVQVPPMRRGVSYYTRKDSLSSLKLHTILSQKDYRMNAFYLVALWEKEKTCSVDLDSVLDALKKPRLTLYLGRKSCPLSLPLAPRIASVSTLGDAFTAYRETQALPDGLPAGGQIHSYWEDLTTEQSGLRADMETSRRDQILSRKRWQFTNRTEYVHLGQEE